jgi:hypothetical protein
MDFYFLPWRVVVGEVADAGDPIGGATGAAGLLDQTDD